MPALLLAACVNRISAAPPPPSPSSTVKKVIGTKITPTRQQKQPKIRSPPPPPSFYSSTSLGRRQRRTVDDATAAATSPAPATTPPLLAAPTTNNLAVDFMVVAKCGDSSTQKSQTRTAILQALIQQVKVVPASSSGSTGGTIADITVDCAGANFIIVRIDFLDLQVAGAFRHALPFALPLNGQMIEALPMPRSSVLSMAGEKPLDSRHPIVLPGTAKTTVLPRHATVTNREIPYGINMVQEQESAEPQTEMARSPGATLLLVSAVIVPTALGIACVVLFLKRCRLRQAIVTMDWADIPTFDITTDGGENSAGLRERPTSGNDTRFKTFQTSLSDGAHSSASGETAVTNNTVESVFDRKRQKLFRTAVLEQREQLLAERNFSLISSTDTDGDLGGDTVSSEAPPNRRQLAGSQIEGKHDYAVPFSECSHNQYANSAAAVTTPPRSPHPVLRTRYGDLSGKIVL